MPPMSCVSNGTMFHVCGCPQTSTTVPHSRRQAFLTTANASHSKSSSDSPLAIRSRNSPVFALTSSSESFCKPSSNSLMRATSGRNFFKSRSFFVPRIAFSNHFMKSCLSVLWNPIGPQWFKYEILSFTPLPPA